jgi:ribosomal subunit interface protein
MQLNLTLSGLDHGPHLEEIVDKKFSSHISKITQHYPDLLITLHIKRDKDGTHIIEANTDLPGKGGKISGHAADNDLALALKLVANHLEKQILRFKEQQL